MLDGWCTALAALDVAALPNSSMYILVVNYRTAVTDGFSRFIQRRDFAHGRCNLVEQAAFALGRQASAAA